MKERKEMKKIFLASLIGRGGTYSCACMIASNMSKDAQVDMLIPTYSKTDLVDKKINLHKTYAPASAFWTLLSTLNVFQHAKNIRTINNSGADTVIFADIHPWYRLYWPFIKKRKISIIHDAEIHEGESSGITGFILKRLTEFLIRKSDKVVVLSKSQLNIIRKKRQNGVILSKHGHFDFLERYSLKKLPLEKNTILFFGRIKKYKGLDFLLDTLENMKDTPFKLIIAGEGDIRPYEKRIKALGEKIELHNAYISDEKVNEYFQRAAFAVLPYTEATQTGVIPIAYAFKKSVIVTDVGSLGEVVVNGKTGLIVDPKDGKALSSAIKRMLRYPAKTSQMGLEGYRYMKKELDWGKITKKLLKDIYH